MQDWLNASSRVAPQIFLTFSFFVSQAGAGEGWGQALQELVLIKYREKGSGVGGRWRRMGTGGGFWGWVLGRGLVNIYLGIEEPFESLSCNFAAEMEKYHNSCASDDFLCTASVVPEKASYRKR